MLTCITCSKQRNEDGEDAPPRTKDAVKTLTSQIKDMALKVSGWTKSKPDNFKIGQRAYTEFNTISERIPYPPRSSTLDWADGDPRFTSLRGDRTPHINSSVQDEDEPKEWIAHVEPGVQITFVSLPRGGNDLKCIRFSREMFNNWEAQRWWGENLDRIIELYNIQRFNQQVINTPGRSEDGRDSTYSRLGSTLISPRIVPPMTPRYTNYYHHPTSSTYMRPGEIMSTIEASWMTTSSRDEASSVSISNASDIEEAEWIDEDEPGVFITIRQLMDGTKELRRVRFSRVKFGEVDAKQWWEMNRDRIQAQYLS